MQSVGRRPATPVCEWRRCSNSRARAATRACCGTGAHTHTCASQGLMGQMCLGAHAHAAAVALVPSSVVGETRTKPCPNECSDGESHVRHETSLPACLDGASHRREGSTQVTGAKTPNCRTHKQQLPALPAERPPPCRTCPSRAALLLRAAPRPHAAARPRGLRCPPPPGRAAFSMQLWDQLVDCICRPPRRGSTRFFGGGGEGRWNVNAVGTSSLPRRAGGPSQSQPWR